MIGAFAEDWYEPFSAKHLPAWSRDAPLANRAEGSPCLEAGQGQPSPGVVETHRGTALDGRSFYVWDEDRQTAVAWANKLAAAASPSARGHRAKE